MKDIRLNRKTKAFTLSEMIVVLILTSIVVGLAFSVLTIVQKQMFAIQNNYNQRLELNKLEGSLWLDFNRYSRITYDETEHKLQFSTEIDSVDYRFNEHGIIKSTDTFPIQIVHKLFYFDGEICGAGRVDAIKLETSNAFQNQKLFVYTSNDAAIHMNQ